MPKIDLNFWKQMMLPKLVTQNLDQPQNNIDKIKHIKTHKNYSIQKLCLFFFCLNALELVRWRVSLLFV